MKNGQTRTLVKKDAALKPTQGNAQYQCTNPRFPGATGRQELTEHQSWRDSVSFSDDKNECLSVYLHSTYTPACLVYLYLYLTGQRGTESVVSCHDTWHRQFVSEDHQNATLFSALQTAARRRYSVSTPTPVKLRPRYVAILFLASLFIFLRPHLNIFLNNSTLQRIK